MFAGVEFQDFKNSTTDELAGHGTDFRVRLNDSGKVEVKTTFTADVERPELREVLVLAKRKETDLGSSDEDLRTRAEFKVNFLSYKRSLSPVLSQISEVALNTDQLTYLVGKIYKRSNLVLLVTLKRGEEVVLSKQLTEQEYQLLNHPQGSKVAVELRNLGVELQLGEAINVQLQVGLHFKGKVLNSSVQGLDVLKTLDTIVQ